MFNTPATDLEITGEIFWANEHRSADSSLCLVLCNTFSVKLAGAGQCTGGERDAGGVAGGGQVVEGGVAGIGGDGQLVGTFMLKLKIKIQVIRKYPIYVT